MTGYIGIGGTAKKIKNIYIGVGGTAKQIKKAYIGVGGVAKLWYRSKLDFSYYGTVTDLGTARQYPAGGTNGTHAIIANGSTNVTDAYTAALVHSTPTAMAAKRYYMASATAGTLSIYAGGYDGSNAKNTVEAYNESLSVSTATNLPATAVGCAGASVSGVAIFGGGGTIVNGRGTQRNNVVSYNSALTQSTAASGLSVARVVLGAATVGDYVVFAGGTSGGYDGESVKTTVDAYTSSLVRSTPASALSEARCQLGGASTGKWAVFAGGTSNGIVTGTKYANVDAYNSALVKASSVGSLSVARMRFASVSLKGFVIFAGGMTGSSSYSSTVDAYDEDLIKVDTSTMALSVARCYLAGADIGNYALFAGGYTGSNSKVVDVYQVS